MSTINLDLNIDEVNLILESLGAQPYVKVHQLIARIHHQASSQLQNPSLQSGSVEHNGAADPSLVTT